MWPTIALLHLLALSQNKPGPPFKPPGPNVALGRPYTLSPRPNYPYCTDPGDVRQLTDGKYIKGYFWVQKGCVGWSRAPLVTITLDLGRVEPIAGLSFSTAAGTASVYWPRAILILVSENGGDFYFVGDLVSMSAKFGPPPEGRYATHRFVTDELRTKGRFVRLVVIPSGSYAFCDEIEVYRGPDELLRQPIRGERAPDIEGLVNALKTDSGARRRMLSDIETMRGIVKASPLPPLRKQKLLSLLESMRREVERRPRTRPEGFRAVVPFDELHARILAVNAEVLRARGFPPLCAWPKSRWDPLLPWEAPEKPPSSPPELPLALMRGETRAEVVNLTNATDKPLTLRLRIEGPKGIERLLTVHEVLFTDTQEGKVIADALPEARRTKGGWLLTIPAGTTRQVWLSLRPPRDFPPGDYRLSLVAEGGPEGPLHIPLEVHVSELRFPKRPSLSLCAWDYTDGPIAHRKPRYGLTPENVKAAIEDMADHFYDSPWASRWTAPWPTSEDLDEHGNLRGRPDFSKFDKWVSAWRGVARRYFVFLSVGSSFVNFRMGTKEFRRAVSQWAAAWAKHCQERLRLKPKQVGLLLVDEPHSKEQDRTIIEWARAIKAGTDFFLIWEDPTHRQPWRTALPELFEVCDALCPNLNIFAQGGEEAQKFYEALRRKGKELWFYQCSGPARLLDPYYYHRLLAWHCFKHGAVGMGFWAYGDTGWAEVWNEYTAKRTIYSPVYIGRDFVVTGKHWEAVREGVEDYEYLRMLRDVARKTEASNPALARKAERLLEEALHEVVPAHKPELIPWNVGKDRTIADRMRVRVLEFLEEAGAS